MQSIEIVLTMLLLVLASGYLVRMLPFAVPLPLVQIGLGAGVAAFFNRGVTLDPDFFFLLFLPPLLFLDGWRIPKEGLFQDARTILQLALGLVVFTVLGIGFFLHWLIPAMPLAVAFALAAIVSPTDPVALSSIAARVPIPRRLMHILEGESLLNDASGLVCFRFAVVAAMTGQFSLASASLTFLWLALGGVGVGVLVTLGITHGHVLITRRFGQDAGLPILVSLLTPFGAYLAAEHIGASGILASVAAGITMSYVELSGSAPAATRVQRTAVWDSVQFTLNGIAFVLLGEQLPGILARAIAALEESGQHEPWWLLVYALAINVGLALLRLLWVVTSLRVNLVIARQRGKQAAAPPWRLVFATSLTGVRGAITLAGVLTLPLLLPDGSAFPARDLAIFLATTVILFSLLIASFGLPPLLAGLQFSPELQHEREEDLARHRAASAALTAIKRAQRELSDQNTADTEVYAAAALRVMALYQRQIDADGANDVDAEQLRKADAAERALRLAGLRAARQEIFSLARYNRVSDDIARRLVREIDLLEARYSP
ncbi:Na+/H+ antiporter [Dokdonella sp.]|uniref:Na+/H+ antiporter n=1 Tax=Dokdonella sp. TaxID=2291710 RepID=UPI001B269988|nr:Na+/H+ antiporter [Dokdonella sp.]MBO9661386.1 Na+/H+ antiporter [Dokdonella sp.]